MSQLTVPVGDSDHVEGPADAPVTLVEYGDFQCPYCGDAHPVIKAVQAAMGERLRFVFRHFPLTKAHAHAQHAAEIAEAAATVDRFWWMHDLLFEHQLALEDENLVSYAESVGLDAEAAHQAFNGRYDEHIKKDFRGGIRSGVNGTPCFFINGQRYDGPRDVDAIVAALETAIS
jgi:protein-disulfide isomerase